MNKLSEKYIEIIREAITNVGLEYQFVSVCGDDELIRRERVWCYEFYHQIRKIIEKAEKEHKTECKNIQFNGEIDKKGHKVIKENFNPDFIIHNQGSMDNNLVVIEVKANNNIKEIEKDFRTLCCMLNNYNYQLGVFILVDYTFKDLEKTVNNMKLPKCVDKHKTNIFLFSKDINGVVTKKVLKEIL